MGVLKGRAVADRRILSVRERTSEARAKRVRERTETVKVTC